MLASGWVCSDNGCTPVSLCLRGLEEVLQLARRMGVPGRPAWTTTTAVTKPGIGCCMSRMRRMQIAHSAYYAALHDEGTNQGTTLFHDEEGTLVRGLAQFVVARFTSNIYDSWRPAIW